MVGVRHIVRIGKRDVRDLRAVRKDAVADRHLVRRRRLAAVVNEGHLPQIDLGLRKARHGHTGTRDQLEIPPRHSTDGVRQLAGSDMGINILAVQIDPAEDDRLAFRHAEAVADDYRRVVVLISHVYGKDAR